MEIVFFFQRSLGITTRYRRVRGLEAVVGDEDEELVLLPHRIWTSLSQRASPCEKVAVFVRSRRDSRSES